MKRIKFALLAAGLFAGAIAPQAQAEDPVSALPFERCITTPAATSGWKVEVCGFMFLAGPAGAFAAEGHCRALAFREGATPYTEVVPVAAAIRTCKFTRNGADFGSNLRAAQPGAAATVTGVLPQLVSSGTYGVCLEGKALLSNTEEPARGAPSDCANF